MDTTAEMHERHRLMLAELAALGMDLARNLQQRTVETRYTEGVEAFTLAFHRISRSVRMTVALEAKLVAGMQRQAGERESAALERQGRQARLRAAISRAAWTESEGEDAEDLLESLSDDLSEFEDEAALLSLPVELHIARLRADLGLKPGQGPGADLCPSIRLATLDGKRPSSSGRGVGEPDAGGRDPRRSG